MKGSTRQTWLVLALLTLLTLVLSWPLPLHMSDRVPGTATWAFDESTFIWNIWHFKHALLDLHSSPLHSELIWYPLGIDLILYTYNFFNALIALPLMVAINLPLASNVTLWLATLLSGLGVYLLALYLLATHRPPAKRSQPPRPQVWRLAALLAAIVYAFGANRAIYAASLEPAEDTAKMPLPERANGG